MVSKSLDPQKARDLLRHGRVLEQFDIEELDLSNLVFEHDVLISDCHIGRIIADNAVFQGKFELVRTPVGEAIACEDKDSASPVPDEDLLANQSSFSKATFEQQASFEEIEFGCCVDFSNSNFNRAANFKKTHFGGDLYFMDATFDDIPSFEGARFHKEVIFSGVIFGVEVIFRGATFLGASDFTQSQFGSAEFEEATFQGETVFRHANFQDWADFSEATFEAELDFAESNFNNGADFSGATFHRLARFEKASFARDCYFVEAVFHQLADFDSITFGQGADFRQCLFKDRVEFRHATMQDGSFAAIECYQQILLSDMQAERLNFQRAHFRDSLDFSGSNVKQRIDFFASRFDRKTTFDHSNLGATTFSQSQFRGVASFKSVTFEAGAEFQKVSFLNEVDFSNSHFKGNADFGEARFSRRALWRNIVFQQKTDFQAVNFQGKTDFAETVFRRSVRFEGLLAEDVNLNWSQIKGKLYNQQRKRYKRAMKEYGLLKALFEKQNNYSDMDRAYRMFKRMERKSRPTSLKHPIKLFNKMVNLILLDLGAGYGTRPLNIAITTFVIILLFGIFYYFFNDQIIIDTQVSSPVKNLLFCIYFSFLSFVTLGAENLYADYAGWLKYVVAGQAFLGFFLMTLFVATFTRKVIR